MILNIVQRKIEPDIVVVQMSGRITMGSDSQKIEWGLAELRKADGSLRLVGAQGMVEEVLAITSVNKIVPLCRTTAEAAEDFHRL